MSKRKYRTKIEKLHDEHSKETFRPTQKDCVKWFRIINREVFKNAFTQVIHMDIRVRRTYWAYYSYERIDGPYYNVSLHLNLKYRNKKHFVEMLAHEMVHHYQLIHGQPLGHGPSFQYWVDRFASKGLDIDNRDLE